MKGAIPLFAAVVCGLVACGGEDSGSGGYREEASALCREVISEAKDVRPPSSPRQLEEYLRATLRFSRRYTARLEALEPPPELAGLHERSKRLNRRAEELTQAAVEDLAGGGDPRELLPAYFGELLEIGRRDNEVSRKLGLPDCVVPLPGPGEAAPAPA